MDVKVVGPRIVVIKWFDSAICAAATVYTTLDAIDVGLVILETTGWLVKETTEPYGGYYVLAASKHDGEDWRGIQLIPKANVIRCEQMFFSPCI